MNSYYEKNKQLLISFFAASSKHKELRLGLELEHFVVFNNDKSTAYFGEHGVLQLLNELSVHFPSLYYIDDVLLGMYNDSYSITLEPSSQLEISIAPQASPSKIEKIYADFQSLAAPVLKKHGLFLKTLGYRPAGRADELPLIPKKRYEYMDAYFKKSGSCGMNMMRGTASTQLSIDYTSEADFVRKYRLAYILMPALKLICDNTPVYENVPNALPLIRTHIWRNTDSARCRPPADLFKPGFGFASYADYILNMPLILIAKNNAFKYVGEKNAATLYGTSELTSDELSHILSMAFPDVRLKGYIEIRGADALPVSAALGYAALIGSVFYSKSSTDYYLSKYNIDICDITAAEDSLMQYGRKGLIYDTRADAFINELFQHAYLSCPADEIRHLDALRKFYEKK